MIDPTPSDSTTSGLRKLRENIAATLALLIVIPFLLMLGFAFAYEIGNFTNIKELLGYLSPFVGIALGYYFNKVTSEARAESAESNAKSANETAKTATEAVNTASDVAKQATEARNQIETKAHDLQGGLSVLTQAAEKLLPGRAEEAQGVF